jgi:hypothetical protein
MVCIPKLHFGFIWSGIEMEIFVTLFAIWYILRCFFPRFGILYIHTYLEKSCNFGIVLTGKANEYLFMQQRFLVK